MVKNRYGKITVSQRIVSKSRVLTELEVNDYTNDRVMMWLFKEDIVKLIDELEELLKDVE